MAKSIQHKLQFNHPPAVVWDYLTKAELMSQWLMPTDFQPIIGLDFQFRTKPYPQLDFDGTVYCKVLEVVPLKRLSYSWKSGPGEGRTTLDSIVVWQLTPKDNGTELSLNHSGFSETEGLALYGGLQDGWLKNMQKIAQLINLATHGSTNA